jgi:hypothetical protein
MPHSIFGLTPPIEKWQQHVDETKRRECPNHSADKGSIERTADGDAQKHQA